MRAEGVLNNRSRSNAAFSTAEKRRCVDSIERSRAGLLRSTASCAMRKPQCCFAGAARWKIANPDLFIQVGVFFDATLA